MTIKTILIQLFATIIAIEIIFRCFGYQPYQTQKYSLVATPNGYMLPDAKSGFRLGKGQFQITINEKIRYTATHKPDGSRITAYADTLGFRFDSLAANQPNPQKKIALIGGSFPYGMGVDDSLSYPFLWQKSAGKSLDIHNLCMPGYGTYQAIQWFVAQPDFAEYDVLVLHYASFHDERNVLTPSYRVALHHGFLNSTPAIRAQYEKACFPFYDKNGQSACAPMNKLYQNWWGREFSSTINFLQTQRDNANPIYKTYRSVPKTLIQSLNENICQPNNIRLVIATYTNDEATKDIQAFCQKNNIETVDIFVDYTNPDFSNWPYDSHPNAAAHAIYAKKIWDFL